MKKGEKNADASGLSRWKWVNVYWEEHEATTITIWKWTKLLCVVQPLRIPFFIAITHYHPACLSLISARWSGEVKRTVWWRWRMQSSSAARSVAFKCAHPYNRFCFGCSSLLLGCSTSSSSFAIPFALVSSLLAAINEPHTNTHESGRECEWIKKRTNGQVIYSNEQKIQMEATKRSERSEENTFAAEPVKAAIATTMVQAKNK